MMRYTLVRGSHFCPTTVRRRCLSFFGHLHRTDPSQDHYRALQACILGPPNDWRRRIGRPRQSWLRTVEADLRPMNLGLVTSKRRAQDRSAWRKLVTTATSTTSSWRREEEQLASHCTVLTWTKLNITSLQHLVYWQKLEIWHTDNNDRQELMSCQGEQHRPFKAMQDISNMVWMKNNRVFNSNINNNSVRRMFYIHNANFFLQCLFSASSSRSI